MGALLNCRCFVGEADGLDGFLGPGTFSEVGEAIGEMYFMPQDGYILYNNPLTISCFLRFATTYLGK